MSAQVTHGTLGMEFCDGGIDSVIQKEFVSKLFKYSNLSHREMLLVKECVMNEVPQYRLAEQLGISSTRVSQIIAKSIRKMRHAFVKDQSRLLERFNAPSVQKQIKAEQQKDVKERIVVDSHGATHWYRGNLLHREGAPAVVQSNGGQAWFYYGKRHREDGPAIEYADGSKEWWLYGQRHRDVGYAVEHTNGKKEIWRNGAKFD
jgi:predicted transcriptional regulator